MLRYALLAAVLLTAPGCFALSLGGGSDVEQTLTPPTLGEEFRALHGAHASGALDDEEYAAAKRRLIENRGTE